MRGGTLSQGWQLYNVKHVGGAVVDSNHDMEGHREL